MEGQAGEPERLQDEGKTVAIGLSQATVGQIQQARTSVPKATVHNRWNRTDRSSADVLEYCTPPGIGFISWVPVAAGELAAAA
ncbi:aldo/keto reductase [Streptomyces chrestomyceticus]|uniref:aldo/keto reductase n=1 Tax=Streptomyces chrestomyceticus TaxID=68185 RepID=UPI0036C4ECAB